ncbi:MAG: chemotaxis response regulator protein-glutamate methylesterase [Pseudomonadota bacterium]
MSKPLGALRADASPLDRLRSASALGAKSDPIRVMLVDDAVVVRGLLSRWLGETTGVEVVGTFRNGREAVDGASKADPDIIILDIEMPVMDGLEALPLLLKACPNASIIMASTLTTRNADISLKALSLGARDYLPKPEGNHGVTTSVDFRRDLILKVETLGKIAQRKRSIRKTSPASKPVSPLRTVTEGGAKEPTQGFTVRRQNPGIPRILAVGSSTGGPQALMAVMKELGPALSQVPVVLAQHMPAAFTPVLAQHLARSSNLSAMEGEEGQDLKPGHIYIAPGGKHMTLEASGAGSVIRLNDGPPINFCKPAVDPLFESVSKIYRAAALGLVLTGMGNDGAAGAKIIADGGGNIVAQDEETSVVWGMPGATAQAGAACSVLPLSAIPGKISRMLKGQTI